MLLLFFTFSCKKQNSLIDYNPAVKASEEFAANQQMMTQILNTYFKSLSDSALWANGNANIDGARVSIKYLPVLMMEFQYDAWGNYDGYGHYRMGAIEAIPESDFTGTDAVVNFNFVGFLYDKDTLDLTKMTVQNIESQDDKKFEVKVDSAVLILLDTSGQYSFNMNQIFRLEKDPSTQHTSPLDKIYISGTMDGITMDLTTYFAVIAESAEIIDNYNCRWLKNGPIDLQVTGFQFPSTIYFPQPDSCINQYMIEIDGNPFLFPFDYIY
jgi:hypothetical protein